MMIPALLEFVLLVVAFNTTPGLSAAQSIFVRDPLLKALIENQRIPATAPQTLPKLSDRKPPCVYGM